MRLLELEPPTDDTLAMYASLETPTQDELMEFDRLCRRTSRFDGWDIYAQQIDDLYVVIVANRARRL